jgi:hypothetical protein
MGVVLIAPKRDVVVSPFGFFISTLKVFVLLALLYARTQNIANNLPSSVNF